MISVCIATYNGEKYIKEQLDSILVQINEDDEIIISDDSSSDQTLEVIRSYKDDRIKVFKNPNKGITGNFENAIKKASGDYIFLSDQDDIWESNKVRTCMIDFDNGHDLVLSDCTIFYSDTKQVLQESYFRFNRTKRGVLENIRRNHYMGCCMAFNAKVKKRVIPFPNNLPMHDSWIGIISELHFNVKFNTAKLVKYRSHSKNASYTGSGKSENSFMKRLSFRFFLIYYLATNYLKF